MPDVDEEAMNFTASQSRSAAIKVRSSIVLSTLAILAIGLSACGSSSSSSSGESTAAVVKKEAGSLSKDVQLTVTDEVPNTDYFFVCFSTPVNCEDHIYGPNDGFELERPIARLKQGQSVTHTTERAQGEIAVQEGEPSLNNYKISFEAFNPNVGQPWISVGPGGRRFDLDTAGKIELSEGESQERRITSGENPPTVKVERGEDTDYKVMTLRVHP
jgi:hypothetical protein